MLPPLSSTLKKEAVASSAMPVPIYHTTQHYISTILQPHAHNVLSVCYIHSRPWPSGEQ
jgi:hypothetical protein